MVNRQIVHGRIPGPAEGEDSVEPRERPPIGMAGPGRGATNELRILSVEFASDHGVLLDYDTDKTAASPSISPSGRRRRAIRPGIR